MLPPTNSNPLRNRRLAVDSTSMSVLKVTLSSVPVALAGTDQPPPPLAVMVLLTMVPPESSALESRSTVPPLVSMVPEMVAMPPTGASLSG